MAVKECCEKWAWESAKVLNPRDGQFTESERCPRCGARLLLTFERKVNDSGKFEGYVLLTVGEGPGDEKRGWLG